MRKQSIMRTKWIELQYVQLNFTTRIKKDKHSKWGEFYKLKIG